MNTSTKIILWSVLALFLVVLFVVDLNKKNKNRQYNRTDGLLLIFFRFIRRTARLIIW